MELSDWSRNGASDSLLCAARRRYGWHPGNLSDAAAVGRVLCGDPATINKMRVFLTEGFPEWRMSDPCLFSLVEAVTDWHRHTEAGTLPESMSPYPPVSSAIPLQAAADYLTVLGMWGETTQYETPEQVSDTGRVFLDIPPMMTLPGWTTVRLAELYALGYAGSRKGGK